MSIKEKNNTPLEKGVKDCFYFDLHKNLCYHVENETEKCNLLNCGDINEN